LEHPRKGVIEKVANLVEFWIIPKSELVENSMHEILDIYI
jgi:hypothetical protein